MSANKTKVPSFEESLKVIFDKDGLGDSFKQMNRSLVSIMTPKKPVKASAKTVAKAAPVTSVRAPTKRASAMVKVEPVKTRSADDHPYLKKVRDEHAFHLKTDHATKVAQVSMIEELYEELKGAPDEAIVFHMSGKNDFSSWIRDCVGDWWLGSKVDKIKFEGNPGDAKAELVKTLGERIYKLKNY